MARARSSSESRAPGRRRALATAIVVVFAFALAAVGCYDPRLDDGHFKCLNDDNQCPPGFFCASPCGLCFHDSISLPHDQVCSLDLHRGDGGTAGGSGEGAGGLSGGSAGGGGGYNGVGGSVMGAGGATGTAGVSGSGGAPVGSGGHGGTFVGGSGGTPGGTAGMNGTAGAMGTAGHVGTGGTTATGGHIGSGGAMMGTGGTMGVGGKTGTGGAMMGVGGAMMGTGGAPGLGLGSACSLGTQCASGVCVDKVCCNVACSGQCQACDIAPNQGTCSPVSSGPPHGGRAACGGTGVCGGQCALTIATSAACVFAPMTVSCGAQTCSGNTLMTARFCDGLGTCAAGASSACPLGLECNAAQTACLASCSTSADCTAAAPNCNPSTHQCTTGAPIGSSCSVAADCQNGLCVDNFCCDAACSGSCQACNNMGQEGHCSLVLSGQPHGSRTPCGASGSTCGGRCDGTDSLCHFPMSNPCDCPDPLLGLIGGTCDGTGKCQTTLGLCIL